MGGFAHLSEPQLLTCMQHPASDVEGTEWHRAQYGAFLEGS